jgi:hypothetical protein
MVFRSSSVRAWSESLVHRRAPSVDKNRSPIAKTLGEFTVPAAGASAVYKAASWTTIAKSRYFATYQTHPDRGPVELGSASLTGKDVHYPNADPETTQ